MKKRTVFLALIAVVLVLSTGIGSALAYFSTYAVAEGGYTIHLGDETDIEETFSGWTKHVTVSNKEGSEPVLVRAKAFCGKEFEQYLVYSDESGKWAPGADGYYYYSDPLKGGEFTEELLVAFRGIPDSDEELAEFNVVVIYESTPVRYDSNGDIIRDCWDIKLDTGRSEGGA